MAGSNLGRKCIFANECSVYQGQKIIRDIPVTIYRNVFCYNGEKGWKNCEIYRNACFLIETDINDIKK